MRQETNINLTMVAEPKESFLLLFLMIEGKLRVFIDRSSHWREKVKKRDNEWNETLE